MSILTALPGAALMPAGPPGPAGGPGADGRSAYQIAVDTGAFSGTEAEFATMLVNSGSAGTTVSLIANGIIPGGVFGAAYGSGRFVRATPADVTQAAGRAIGYVDALAKAGATVALRKSGSVRVSGSLWTAGDAIFLGDNAAPTNVRRTSGWVQQVGVATGFDTFDLAIGPAEAIVSLVTLDTIGAIVVQALTDVVRALSLTMPDAPGIVWRSQTFVTLSSYPDGTPYTAPAGYGQAGALDPVTALLGLAVPRALRALPSTPPTTAGTLWRNGVRLALTANPDGSAYPTTPMPASNYGLLVAVRTALGPWLSTTLPALPALPPLSTGALWRTADHALAARL